jgi:hypothetical protein
VRNEREKDTGDCALRSSDDFMDIFILLQIYFGAKIIQSGIEFLNELKISFKKNSVANVRKNVNMVQLFTEKLVHTQNMRRMLQKAVKRQLLSWH